MDQNYQPQPTNPIPSDTPSSISEMPPPNNISTAPTFLTPPKPKKVGPIIVVLVIVLVLVIAALYLFASSLNNQQQAPTDTSQITATNAVNANETAALETVTPMMNTADDPQSLQNDLNAATQGIDGQNF